MKLKMLVLPLMLATALVACGKKETAEDLKVKQTFMESCLVGGSEAVCQCGYEKVVAEFGNAAGWESKMDTPEKQNAFITKATEFGDQCRKEHADKK